MIYTLQQTGATTQQRQAGPLRLPLLLAGIFFLLAICCYTLTAYAETASGDDLLKKLSTKSTTIRSKQLQVDLLLQAIGRKGKVNVLVKEGIDDTISLELENIKLDDLFRLIMETKELRYYESNGALIVEKASDFIEKQRDVVTVRLCPTFGNAEGHQEELTVLLSSNGSLNATSDGNCLVVHDHQENVLNIKKLLADLDKPIPQVHIKARIVTMDKSTSRQLGIKWGYTNQSVFSDGTLSASTDLSVAEPTTDIVFGFIRDMYTLDLELSALQEKNKLHLLSEPLVVVVDGQEAEIKQGQEVPFDSGTQENRSTTFREAVLSLKVIPKILHNDYIKLDVRVTNDSVDEMSTGDGQPLLNRQEIKTNLFLENGVTVVIGGILTKGNGETKGGVPILSDIPILGGLFRNSDKLNSKTELLVFLTPTILTKQQGVTLRDEPYSLTEQMGDETNSQNSPH